MIGVIVGIFAVAVFGFFLRRYFFSVRSSQEVDSLLKSAKKTNAIYRNSYAPPLLSTDPLVNRIKLPRK